MSLVEQFQAATDRANQANEQRYQQILSGYEGLRGRTMSDLQGLGRQERADIDRVYRGLGSDVYQRLVNRGFANSSLLGTMRQGVERERTSAYGRLNDRLAQQRIGADLAISQGQFGVMERRNDVGPDPALLVQLAQQFGASGLGPGGSFRPPIGAPNYGQMYQSALMRHLAMMGMGGGGNRFPVPLANLRAQQNRLRRYGPLGVNQRTYGVDASNLNRFSGIA